MRLAQPVMDKIAQYGGMNFQSVVQEHVKTLFAGINLGEINAFQVYHAYVYAYVIATKRANFEDLADNVTDAVDDPGVGAQYTAIMEAVPDFNPASPNEAIGFTLQTDGYPTNPTFDVTFLGITVHESEYSLLMSRLHDIFQQELLSQTGLVSIINSMIPGTYIDHCGDDLATLVIETEAGFSL